MITLKKLRDFCFLFQPQMLYVISYFLATNCIFLLISFKYCMKCNNYLFVLESVSKELWRIKIFAGLKVLQDIFGEPKKNILEDEYFLFLSTETTLQNKQNHSINLKPKAYLASFTWAVLLNSKFLFGGTRLGLFAFFIKQFSKDKQKMLNPLYLPVQFHLSPLSATVKKQLNWVGSTAQIQCLNQATDWLEFYLLSWPVFVKNW